MYSRLSIAPLKIRLSWWPSKFPPAQQMQVKMKYGLPCAKAVVKNGPVTIGELTLSGDLRGNELHAPEHRRILGRGIGERNVMLSGTNQNVRRRLRLNVLEGEDLGVFVHEFRGN